METKIIKGEQVRDRILVEIKTEIAALYEKYNRKPGIAFIGFANVPLSKYNIPFHLQLADMAGFTIYKEILNDDTSEDEMFALIDKLNLDDTIDAIVVLQPLPLHLNPIRIINRVKPVKEAEGFHPLNMLATLIPDIQTEKYPMCLPTALVEMLKDAAIQLKPDQEWVFVLDQEFFTNPLTYMVVRSAASKVVPHTSAVTYISKESEHMIESCKRADILVVVTKFPEYIKPEWLKPGVGIIDIYSNLVKEIPSKEDPSKLIPIIRGGVTTECVMGIADFILPIPGGLMGVVLTILLRNALQAFKNKL